MRSPLLKRLFDLVVALAALIVFSPLLLALTIAVVAINGWPPVFVQARPGLHGKIFKMYKFRSMTNAKGSDGQLLPDAQRVTAFGRLMRSTSLDELPELINVLKGDMSLVGPRPLLVEYLPLYSPEQARRHDVRPGITGWAQINGRNAINWEQKLAFDVWYVDHWTLATDVNILVSTCVKAIRREGVTEAGVEQKFRG